MAKKKRGRSHARWGSHELEAGGSRLHLATVRGIVERFPCDADHLVGVAFDAAQIDVLDRVVRLGHGPGPSWAVDLGLAQRAVERLLVTEAAPDRGQARGKEQRRVVSLHGVDIRLHAVSLAIRVTKLLVFCVLDAVAVMQGRQQPLRRRALRLERSVSEKAGTVERDLFLE